MTASTRLQRARAAALREVAEYRQRAEQAKATCDGINDLDELADAARDYLLAHADHLAARYGARDKSIVAMWRRRANADDYRRALALFWLAERVKLDADTRHGLTPAEKRERDERAEAEARQTQAMVRALIDGLTGPGRQ
jgi:hypothetical protein